MTNKTIDTLIQDIHAVLESPHTPNEANVKKFSENIAKILVDRLSTDRSKEAPRIRLSKLGTPDRKLWFEMQQGPQEDTSIVQKNNPSLMIKFLYGDLIEELVLFLAREAGHTVEGEQEEITIDGVLGHRDCKIDGITTDVKSASKYGFQKFEKGTLFNDDPFGYIAQISAYSFSDNSPYGAFIALNKESGDLALLKVTEVDMINPRERIKRINQVLELKEPPSKKCYEPKPLGKSGNLVLNNNCTYCKFKRDCWKDANNSVGIRSFNYSDGIKEFVTVVEEPRVEEVTYV
jgi:hypothetical protein